MSRWQEFVLLIVYARCGEPLVFQTIAPWLLAMLTVSDGSCSSATSEGPKVPHTWPMVYQRRRHQNVLVRMKKMEKPS